MNLLALNTVLPYSMRVKYQFAIGALPIGFMLASFLPLWRFASWLETGLGIPANSSIKEQQNGLTWFVLTLVTMAAYFGSS
jgi:hypothetical protein